MLQWRIAVGAEETTAVLEPALEGTGGVFVCAHGAGGHMADRGLIGAAQALRSAGFDVVRFNFLYREKGSRRPDPMPVLKECNHIGAALRVSEKVFGDFIELFSWRPKKKIRLESR